MSVYFFKFLFIYFFAVPGIEPWGVLPQSYTPSPIFYSLFFLFIYFFAVPGIEPRGVLPPSYTPQPTFIFYLFIFLRYRGLNAGAFYLRATPPALLFILDFETGSYEVAEGLTK